MWFDDDNELLGKRLFRGMQHRRQASVLRVNARLSAQRKIRTTQAALWIVMPTLLAALTVLGWHGLRWCAEALFVKNQAFTIRTLDIRGGELITAALVREFTGLHEGMNLFSFSIKNIRSDFLRRTPALKSMAISRNLPDGLRIEVAERQPLARLGRWGYVVLDREGIAFGQRLRDRRLPSIVGYDQPRIRPGEKVAGRMRDAVTLLDLCERTGAIRELAIQSIDVSGNFRGVANDMRLTLDGGPTVDIWWPRQAGKAATEKDLEGRLLHLVGVLRRADKQGLTLETVNLTLDDYQNNCPVTAR